MNIKIKKETLINVLSSIVLGGFLMYLSKSFGELITLFIVFPFLVIYINEGWKLALLSIVSSVLIGAIFVDLITLVYMFLYIVGVTFLAGSFLKKKKDLGTTILYSSFIKLFLLVAMLGIGFFYTKINPIETMKELMYSSIEDVGKTLGSSLDITKLDVDNFMKSARDTVDMGIEILPAILFMLSYISVAINILLGLKISKKSGHNLGYNKKINEYSPGRDLKFVSGIFALVALLMYILNFEFSRIVISNLIAVLSFFFFLDGFLLSDYIYSKGGRKIMRILMPILILLVLKSFLIYVIIGFFDVLFNFRGRMLTNGKK